MWGACCQGNGTIYLSRDITVLAQFSALQDPKGTYNSAHVASSSLASNSSFQECSISFIKACSPFSCRRVDHVCAISRWFFLSFSMIFR